MLLWQSAIGLTYGRHEREGHGSMLHDCHCRGAVLGERRRRDAGAGADADVVGCVELGGELGGAEKQKE